jgi:multidrug resistance efflux pump
VLENQLGLVGRIEAATHTILTAPFDGVVQDLAITEGQRVERGQRLLEFDTAQLDIELREALASQLKAQRALQDIQNWEQSEEVSRARRALTNARLNLDSTEATLADTRRLFDRGIVARMEVDSLVQQAKSQRLDFTAAQAELRAVQSRGGGENLQIAEMELANAQARHLALLDLYAKRELYAPYAGIVLLAKKEEVNSDNRPQIHPGMRVTHGAPLFALVSLERIKAVARIEETDLHQLSEGMPVQITGDGFAGMTLHGRIASIGVQAIASTYGSGASYDVVVSIEPLASGQRQRMRLGMSARLTITTYRSDDGLAVPVEALNLDDQGNTTIEYRESMSEAPQWKIVTIGRAVPQGVEIFGIESGYVALPARR